MAAIALFVGALRGGGEEPRAAPRRQKPVATPSASKTPISEIIPWEAPFEGTPTPFPIRRIKPKAAPTCDCRPTPTPWPKPQWSEKEKRELDARNERFKKGQGINPP